MGGSSYEQEHHHPGPGDCYPSRVVVATTSRETPSRQQPQPALTIHSNDHNVTDSHDPHNHQQGPAGGNWVFSPELASNSTHPNIATFPAQETPLVPARPPSAQTVSRSAKDYSLTAAVAVAAEEAATAAAHDDQSTAGTEVPPRSPEDNSTIVQGIFGCSTAAPTCSTIGERLIPTGTRPRRRVVEFLAFRQLGQHSGADADAALKGGSSKLMESSATAVDDELDGCKDEQYHRGSHWQMFKRRKSRRGSQAVCHEDRPQSRPGLLSYHLRLTQLLQRRQEQQQQQHRARESLPLHRNSSGEMRRSDQSDGRRAATWRLGSQAWVRLRSTPSSPRASGLRRNVFSFSSVLGQPRTPAQPPADDREDGADDGAEVDCQTQGNHQHHYRRRCLATIGAATFAADRDNRLDAARTSGWCGSPPPFQHLSNALPWASSARQMNSSLYLAQHLSPTADSNSNDRAMPATRLPGYESVPLGGSRPSTPSSSPFPPTKEQDQIQKAIDTLLLHQRMLVLLVKSIMIYGAPIHLNQNMERMAEFLDLEASLFILPGMAVISFDDSITHTSETKVLQCHHEWDMYRLEQTDKIWKHVVCHKMSVQEAVGELERLMNNGGYYPWYVLWPVWGILSWAVSLLAFRGGWTDGVCACGLGLLVGTMHLVASRFPAYANFFEVSAAMVSGFGASLFQRWVCYSSVALSSMAVLFPGLLMTTGVIELCSRQLISGTVRMFYALVLSFVIAFGLHIGNSIYTELFRHGQTVPASAQIESCTGLPPYFLFATVPVATTCIGMLIQVHWRHFVSINVVSGATFAIYWVFQNKLGLTSLAVTIASFSLGLMANTWSRFSGQTAYAILLPGQILLVPGSLGIRGIIALLEHDGGHSGLAIEMVLISISIMVGLFASTCIICSFGKKRSALLTV